MCKLIQQLVNWDDLVQQLVLRCKNVQNHPQVDMWRWYFCKKTLACVYMANDHPFLPPLTAARWLRSPCLSTCTARVQLNVEAAQWHTRAAQHIRRNVTTPVMHNLNQTREVLLLFMHRCSGCRCGEGVGNVVACVCMRWTHNSCMPLVLGARALQTRNWFSTTRACRSRSRCSSSPNKKLILHNVSLVETSKLVETDQTIK